MPCSILPPALATFCWPLPSHSFVRFPPPSSCSPPLPTVTYAALSPFPHVRALMSTRRQANIVPVIATNHTVTIAAELVSMILLCMVFRFHIFSPQTNGTHLVGQCEISHPVVRPLSLEGEDEYMSSLSFDTISPTVSTQSQNVLFGADSKDSYEKLRSPISRTSIRPILCLSPNRHILTSQDCTT